MGNTTRMVSPEGAAVEVPVGEEQIYADKGFTAQTNAARAAQTVEQAREDYYSAPTQLAKAAFAAGARGVTGGASDVLFNAVGLRDDVAALREYNPTLSTALELAGSLAPTGVGGLAERAGARIGRVAEDAGAAAQILGAAKGAAVEGAIQGAGQAVSELALSDDPLTVERIASTIGSNVLMGGATGGAVGGAGKAIGLGLRKAKTALDDIASRGIKEGAEIGDDLSKLDTKGLRAAQKAEESAIESARVPKRAEVADEIKAFRQELKENKVWLATKGAEDPEIRAIGRRTLKADKALDNLLDDPKALAENPKAALRQLRIQEAGLDDLVNKHGDSLRTKFATDTSGERQAALDYASTALEKNRSLQAKIGELSGAPASSKLTAIQDAMTGLSMPKTTGLGSALGDAGLGYALGAAAGVPVLGTVLAGAKLGMGVMKKLGAHQAEVAARGSKAVQALLNVGEKVGPAAPVIASKVLSGARFIEQQQEKRGAKQKAAAAKAPDLATSFRARSEELRAQVQPTPDGKVMMRPEARARVAERLAAVRAINPMLADRLETMQARKVEFLAPKLPTRPDAMGMQIGPDRWQPSDQQMRQYARYEHAVEDPMGVVERMASGQITPEDVEAMKAVYPEMHADIVRQIIEQLPSLQKTLPYQRRLALSIFSGVPVEPVMHPQVLSRLQASFKTEPGTEGGVQAPRAQPAFGSVSKPEPTPAQQRGA